MSTVPLTFANCFILKYIYPNSLTHLIDELNNSNYSVLLFSGVVKKGKRK